MTKLQKAINHFSKRHVEEGSPDYYILAEALEEIRDAITPTNPGGEKIDSAAQPAPQSEHFKPWDCVRAKPGTRLYTKWADAELVLGFGPDKDDEYHVYNPDDDGMLMDSAEYVSLEDLIFVRRLKPRAQAPQRKAPSAPPANPIFHAGEYVFDTTDGRNYEVMQTTGAIAVQGRDLETNQPSILHAHFLRKIDPPAPRFTFGDRVRISGIDLGFRFIDMDTDGIHARIYDKEEEGLAKIPLALITPLDTAAD